MSDRDRAGMSSDEYGYRGQYGSGHNYDTQQNYVDRWNDQINQLNYRPGEHTGKGPKGYRRSDERIMEEVCDILWQHGDIDASEIIVRVENGEVTLEGMVDSRRTKRLAEDVIEHVSGIQDVHNRLRVQGQQRHMGDQGQDYTGSVPTEELAQDASVQTSIQANTVHQTGITGIPDQ
jgi:osmotically-inducible protein OsmY